MCKDINKFQFFKLIKKAGKSIVPLYFNSDEKEENDINKRNGEVLVFLNNVKNQ